MKMTKEFYDRIIYTLEYGKTVYFTTAYVSTKVSKKHIKLLSFKNGDIFIGKVCYTGCAITRGE